MAFQKIYSLSFGTATKYYWFKIIERVHEGMDFENEIKKGNFTFTKYSGSTEADCHGSTLAMDFFSQKLIDNLDQNQVVSYNKFKISFESKISISQNYYHIEINSSIPKIVSGDIYTKPNLEKYCVENETSLDQILILSNEDYYIYADFNKWDGNHLFTVTDTSLILITGDLKTKLEKSKLKNIVFKEYKFYNEI